MREIKNIRELKKEYTEEPDILVGEMEDNSLVITHDGVSQTVPILGLFVADGKYYVTLLVQESGEEAIVIYNIIKNGLQESIKVITSKEEWDIASKAWASIVDVAAENL